MRRWTIMAAFLALAGPAAGAPANTLNDMYAELHRCVSASLPARGTDVTIVFMLNRRGALIGKPRLTHAVWPNNSDPRDAAAKVAADFNRCLPLDITDALGGAIAGRLFSYRLHIVPKSENA